MDPYEVLGVSPTASPDEIRKAYRSLVKKYHPDINTSEDAVRMTSIINEAYDRLVDKREEFANTQLEQQASETSEEIRQQERYWRWFRANQARKRKNEEQWMLEEEAYLFFRKAHYVVALLCVILIVDFFLPVRLVETVPILGYQEVSRGRRGRSLPRSYMRTAEGDLRVPDAVHLNYDYYADRKSPILIEYTPILSRIKRIGIVYEEYTVMYSGTHFTTALLYIVGGLVALTVVIIINQKYQPVCLLFCLINFFLIIASLYILL
jgi:hypothetical protein